jgi:hypothetical protein
MRALKIMSGCESWMNLPVPIRFSGYKIAGFTGIQTKLGPNLPEFFQLVYRLHLPCRLGWTVDFCRPGQKAKGRLCGQTQPPSLTTLIQITAR